MKNNIQKTGPWKYILLFLFCLKMDLFSQPAVIIPDFRVNDIVGPGNVDQSRPSAASNLEGKTIVVWQDERNAGGDIYAQYLSMDGSLIGTNFRVNEDAGHTFLHTPLTVMQDNGTGIVAWMESSGGEDAIYIQCIDSDGSLLGSNMKIDMLAGRIKDYDIALNEMGKGVIVWDRYANIYGQLFSFEGLSLGESFRINDDKCGQDQEKPAVATDRNGNFMVVWEDHFGGGGLYAQRLSSNGTRIGSNFRVVYAEGDYDMRDPDIAFDPLGNVIIVWTWYFQGLNCGIWAQRCLGNGVKVGGPFRINDSPEGSSTVFPSVAIDHLGNSIIAWIGDGMEEPGRNVYMQPLIFGGIPVGGNICVNEIDGRVAYETEPVLACDGQGGIVVVWGDRRNGSKDIYAQRFSYLSSKDGCNINLIEDEGSSFQCRPSIHVDANGNFAVTWIDNRPDAPGVYARSYTETGTQHREPVLLQSETEENVCVGMDREGNCVVVRKISYDNLSARRFSSDWISLGAPLCVNRDPDDPYNFNHPWNHSISMNGQGRLVVVWREEYPHDIYAKVISKYGLPVGTNILVNDDVEDNDLDFPRVSMNDADQFVIVWADYWGGIWAQKYSAEGLPLGQNIHVNEGEDSGGMDPCIALLPNGGFVVIWSEWQIENQKENFNIYLQRFTSSGQFLGDKVLVNDDGQNVEHVQHHRIACDESGNWIVAWTDYRNGKPEIYAQLYMSDGTAVGSNFLITSSESSRRPEPAVCLRNGRIYTACVDNRTEGTYFDIWANVMYWDNMTNVHQKEGSILPQDLILYQNYPNPFNASTSIKFSIPKPNLVSLKIYDSHGRLIDTLIEEHRQTGEYRVQWNIQNLPSGIYLYRLEAGDYVETKKMLLVE